MSTRAIMWLAAGWTLAVWGTRIPLLEAGATSTDWIRIGAGLLSGLILAASAGRFRTTPARMRAWINIGFAFAMVFLWLPSLLSVWTNQHSAGFRIVHTVLAGVSMGFGVALAQRAQETMRVTESEQNVDHVGGEQGR